MFHKKTRNSLRVLDAWGVLLLIVSGIVLGFKTGNADVLSGKKQQTRLESGLTHLIEDGDREVIEPASAGREQWMLQGDIEATALGYTCHVKCKSEWISLEFEVEKAARGDERWRDTGAVPAQCETQPTLSHTETLKGGSWATPPQEPEEGMCWLVVSVKRHSP